MSRVRMRDVILSVCVLALLVQSVASQPAPTQRIGWYVAVANARPLPEPRSYRLFESPAKLEIDVTIVNESKAPIVLNATAIPARTRVATVGAAATQLRSNWDTSARFGADQVVRSITPEGIRLDAGEGITWKLFVETVTGHLFPPGELEVRLDLGAALAATARREDGSAWRGNVLDFTAVRVTIVEPATLSEQALARNTAGWAALLDHRDLDAVRLFTEAIEVSPSDANSLIGLGHVSALLNRHQDAISAFERATKLSDPNPSFTPLLAAAYVARGDDADAERVLRELGYRQDQIAAELAKARALTR